MNAEKRGSRLVGDEVSGQPCGHAYSNPPFLCGYPEIDPIHDPALTPLHCHPYTPLERRTGKDRRGGQVAAALDEAVRCEHIIGAEVRCHRKRHEGDRWHYWDAQTEAVRWTAAPQAAPASPSNEAGFLALREAVEFGRAALMFHNQTPGGGTRRCLPECVACEAIRNMTAALAAADAAPERTLPSVEEAWDRQVEAIADLLMDRRIDTPYQREGQTYQDAMRAEARAILYALRAEGGK